MRAISVYRRALREAERTRARWDAQRLHDFEGGVAQAPRKGER
jgi:hypothetical protein